MRGSEFAELAAFVAVADRASFVKAASVLGVSTSRLSQTIRALEERLGVRLLNRTTRSVALTQAGERLLSRVRPALDELGTAVEAVSTFRDAPAGSLRISATSLAANVVIGPYLDRFLAKYPAITLEIDVNDDYPDIVGGRFDAGILAGNWVAKDVVAVRISPASRFVAIASPGYFATRPRPVVPQDLHAHNCIRFLWGGTPYRWAFEKDNKKLEISVSGPLIANDLDLVGRAVLSGVGIGYTLEAHIAALIAEGKLVTVLDDWSRRFDGYHIFYPSRRQMPAALKVFIEFLRGQMSSVALRRESMRLVGK